MKHKRRARQYIWYTTTGAYNRPNQLFAEKFYFKDKNKMSWATKVRVAGHILKGESPPFGSGEVQQFYKKKPKLPKNKYNQSGIPNIGFGGIFRQR